MLLVHSKQNSLLLHALLFTQMPLLMGLLKTQFVLFSIWSFFSLLHSELVVFTYPLIPVHMHSALLFWSSFRCLSFTRLTNFFFKDRPCLLRLSFLQGHYMLLISCLSNVVLPHTSFQGQATFSIGCLSGAGLLRTFFQGYAILIGF